MRSIGLKLGRKKKTDSHCACYSSNFYSVIPMADEVNLCLETSQLLLSS